MNKRPSYQKRQDRIRPKLPYPQSPFPPSYQTTNRNSNNNNNNHCPWPIICPRGVTLSMIRSWLSVGSGRVSRSPNILRIGVILIEIRRRKGINWRNRRSGIVVPRGYRGSIPWILNYPFPSRLLDGRRCYGRVSIGRDSIMTCRYRFWCIFRKYQSCLPDWFTRRWLDRSRADFLWQSLRICQ